MDTPPAAHFGLFLHEQVYLLALRPEKNTPQLGSMYAFGIGGAVISELLLHERISLVPRRKAKLVDVVDNSPLSEPLLDSILQKIHASRRPKNVGRWVGHVAQRRKLVHAVAAGLCDRGILRLQERRFLGVFRIRRYPTVDPSPREELVERLRAVVIDRVTPPDARTLILVSLANGTGLLAPIFGKREMKKRKKWLEELTSGDSVGLATREAIQAAQAAMSVVTAIPG